MKRTLFILLLLGSLLSCSEKPSSRIELMVSIPPQAYLVDRIGGDRVLTHIMVRPGQSPELYEPEPAQVLLLSRIQIYFSLGIPSEQVWMGSIRESFPDIIIVDTATHIQKLPLSHYHEHEAEQGKVPQMDAHTWTSPRQAQVMALSILEALTNRFPEQSAGLLSNYSSLIQDLKDLDQYMRSVIPRGGAFLVYHPAWAYLARDYGLKQVPIEIDGKEPAPGDVMHIMQDIQSKTYPVLFIQPHEMNPSVSLITRKTGMKVQIIDSLSSNYIKNMSNVARQLGDSFKGGSQ